jgi:hypothetical protein
MTATAPRMIPFSTSYASETRSPAVSPPGSLELDYSYLMFLSDRDGGGAPEGSPSREPPKAPTTPCGCSNYSGVDNLHGEMVCENCGVITGRIHCSPAHC